jgi:hypothetical protein
LDVEPESAVVGPAELDVWVEVPVAIVGPAELDNWVEVPVAVVGPAELDISVEVPVAAVGPAELEIGVEVPAAVVWVGTLPGTLPVPVPVPAPPPLTAAVAPAVSVGTTAADTLLATAASIVKAHGLGWMPESAICGQFAPMRDCTGTMNPSAGHWPPASTSAAFPPCPVWKVKRPCALKGTP